DASVPLLEGHGIFAGGKGARERDRALRPFIGQAPFLARGRSHQEIPAGITTISGQCVHSVKPSLGLSACSSAALSGVAGRAVEKSPTAGLTAGGAGARPVGGFAATGGATTATSVFFSCCSRSRAIGP